MRLLKRLWYPALIVATLVWLYFSRDTLAAEVPAKSGWPWWVWPTILFLFTFTIGIISPMSGVGGGVLFVPLSTAFFPFSVDFIRGAGLIMAVTSAYSSVPSFARKGLANIRLMASVGWVVMVSSILGGFVGLWVSNAFPNGKWYIIFALGLILLVVFIIMITSKRVEYPEVKEQDPVSKSLGLQGSWYEPTLGRIVEYRVTRFVLSLFLFAGVGFIAGMFGLGAGWANVPVLNLVMGCPIKVAVATSMAIIMVNAAAIWVYMAKGATLPLIVVPAVLGITLGARVGAWLTVRVKPAFIKYLVLGIMLLAAILNVLKALKGLHII